VGAAISLGGFLAACSSAPPGPNASPTRSTGKPVRGGSLVVGAGEGIPSDYFIGNMLGQQVFTFVQFAWPLFLQSPTSRTPANALADSYQVSSDSLTHTMTIRDGLTFHDGSKLDANAVVQNFKAVLFSDAPLRDKGGYAQNIAFGIPPAISSVDAVDERTIKMVLKQPKADIRRILWYFYVMNPKILARKNYGTDVGALSDAGSGPFRLTNFSPGSFVEFERFDRFFGDVWLDRIRFQLMPDSAAMALALRGGDIQVAVQPAPTDETALAQDPSYTEYVAARPGLNLFFELTPRQSVIATDKRVRQAIWSSLNLQAYIKAFFAPGTAEVGTQPVAVPGAPGYNPGLKGLPYDPARARSLLAEAGVSNLVVKAIGPPTVATLSNTKQLFEAMKSDLQAAGMDLEITVADDATVNAELPKNDLFLDPFDYEDDFLVFPLFYTGLGGVQPPDPRATNPKVKQLLDAAANTADGQKQSSYFQQLQQLNQDELLMGIPLAQTSKSSVAKANVLGWRSAYTQDPENSTYIAAS
jgi:peptide/nickel transport system substrate-binding protein